MNFDLLWDAHFSLSFVKICILVVSEVDNGWDLPFEGPTGFGKCL